ncbi:MAG: hypothetical protein EA383_00015, partial [Spirochaetaceae bacterium]
MADYAMELSQRHFEQITGYLREHLSEIFPPHMSMANAYVQTQLQVDMARLQEGVRANRELMEKQFEFVERRFEITDERFVALDKRFEADATR